MGAGRTFAALLSAGVVTSAVAAHGQGTAPAQVHRTVHRDAETRVGSRANWTDREGVCTARFYPTLDLVSPPAHGTVRFVTGDVGIPDRSGCRNPVYGTLVLYRPSPGYVGPDQFTYRTPEDPMAITHLGPKGNQLTIVLTVR